MTFGDKLYKLRKEKGLSQESLAEQVGTTRQAISKWENNQGFPETEKLVVLGNVFGVSIDYLLKDNGNFSEYENNGYYVSKEKAEAWILHERQTIQKFVTGIVFLICSGIPFVIFEDNLPVKMFLGIISILIGITIIFTLCMTDRDYEYKVLKRNPLLFDKNYLDELTVQYNDLEKKYVNMMKTLPIIIVLGISMLIISKYYNDSAIKIILPIFLMMFSFGVSMFLFGSTMKETYELLIYNDEYVNKWSARLGNRLRNFLNGNSVNEKK